MDRPEVERRLGQAEEMVATADARIQELIDQEAFLRHGALTDAVRVQARASFERARFRRMLN